MSSLISPYDRPSVRSLRHFCGQSVFALIAILSVGAIYEWDALEEQRHISNAHNPANPFLNEHSPGLSPADESLPPKRSSSLFVLLAAAQGTSSCVSQSISTPQILPRGTEVAVELRLCMFTRYVVIDLGKLVANAETYNTSVNVNILSTTFKSGGGLFIVGSGAHGSAVKVKFLLQQSTFRNVPLAFTRLHLPSIQALAINVSANTWEQVRAYRSTRKWPYTFGYPNMDSGLKDIAAVIFGNVSWSNASVSFTKNTFGMTISAGHGDGKCIYSCFVATGLNLQSNATVLSRSSFVIRENTITAGFLETMYFYRQLYQTISLQNSSTFSIISNTIAFSTASTSTAQDAYGYSRGTGSILVANESTYEYKNNSITSNARSNVVGYNTEASFSYTWEVSNSSKVLFASNTVQKTTITGNAKLLLFMRTAIAVQSGGQFLITSHSLSPTVSNIALYPVIFQNCPITIRSNGTLTVTDLRVTVTDSSRSDVYFETSPVTVSDSGSLLKIDNISSTVTITKAASRYLCYFSLSEITVENGGAVQMSRFSYSAAPSMTDGFVLYLFRSPLLIQGSGSSMAIQDLSGQITVQQNSAVVYLSISKVTVRVGAVLNVSGLQLFPMSIKSKAAIPKHVPFRTDGKSRVQLTGSKATFLLSGVVCRFVTKTTAQADGYAILFGGNVAVGIRALMKVTNITFDGYLLRKSAAVVGFTTTGSVTISNRGKAEFSNMTAKVGNSEKTGVFKYFEFFVTGAKTAPQLSISNGGMLHIYDFASAPDAASSKHLDCLTVHFFYFAGTVSITDDSTFQIGPDEIEYQQQLGNNNTNSSSTGSGAPSLPLRPLYFTARTAGNAAFYFGQTVSVATRSRFIFNRLAVHGQSITIDGESHLFGRTSNMIVQTQSQFEIHACQFTLTAEKTQVSGWSSGVSHNLDVAHMSSFRVKNTTWNITQKTACSCLKRFVLNVFHEPGVVMLQNQSLISFDGGTYASSTANPSESYGVSFEKLIVRTNSRWVLANADVKVHAEQALATGVNIKQFTLSLNGSPVTSACDITIYRNRFTVKGYLHSRAVHIAHAGRSSIFGSSRFNLLQNTLDVSAFTGSSAAKQAFGSEFGELEIGGSSVLQCAENRVAVSAKLLPFSLQYEGAGFYFKGLTSPATSLLVGSGSTLSITKNSFSVEVGSSTGTSSASHTGSAVSFLPGKALSFTDKSSAIITENTMTVRCHSRSCFGIRFAAPGTQRWARQSGILVSGNRANITNNISHATFFALKGCSASQDSAMLVTRNVVSVRCFNITATTGKSPMCAGLLLRGNPSILFGIRSSFVSSYNVMEISASTEDHVAAAALTTGEVFFASDSRMVMVGNSAKQTQDSFLQVRKTSANLSFTGGAALVLTNNNIIAGGSHSSDDALADTLGVGVHSDSTASLALRCNTMNSSVSLTNYSWSKLPANQVFLSSACSTCNATMDCDPLNTAGVIGTAPLACTCLCKNAQSQRGLAAGLAPGGLNGGCLRWLPVSLTATQSLSLTSSVSDTAPTLSSSDSETESFSQTESEDTATLSLTSTTTSSFTASRSGFTLSESDETETPSATNSGTLSLTPTSSSSASLSSTPSQSQTVLASDTHSHSYLTNTPSQTRTGTISPTATAEATATPTIPTTTPTIPFEPEIPTLPPRTDVPYAPPCRPTPIPPWILEAGALTHTVEEAFLRQNPYNFTLNASIIADWYLRPTMRGEPLEPSWYSVQLYRGLDDGAPSTFGFSSINTTAVGVQLRRDSVDEFYLEIPPLPDLDVEEEERIEILLFAPYFTSCPPEVAIPIGYFVIQASPDAAAAATEEVVVASQSAALGSSALGAAAAMDAQSLAVIGMMSCAKPIDKKVMKNPRLLSPLMINDSFEGMIAGNFILLIGVAVLQQLAIQIRHRVSKVSMQEARMFVKFPGFLFTVLCITFQGTAICAVKVFSLRSEAPPLLLGCFTIAISLLTPALVMFVVWRYVNAQYSLYDFANFRGGKFKGPIHFLFPYGRWEPRKVSSAYGGMFASIRRTELIWVSLPLWGPSLMVIGASFRPKSSDGCVGQYTALSAVQFITCLVLVILRPYRSLIQNVLASFSAFCLAMVLIASTMGVKNSGPLTKAMTLGSVQAQTACTIARVVWMIVEFIQERCLLAGGNTIKAGHRESAIKRKQRAQAEMEKDLEDELLMTEINVDGAQRKQASAVEEDENNAGKGMNRQFIGAYGEDLEDIEEQLLKVPERPRDREANKEEEESLCDPFADFGDEEEGLVDPFVEVEKEGKADPEKDALRQIGKADAEERKNRKGKLQAVNPIDEGSSRYQYSRKKGKGGVAFASDPLSVPLAKVPAPKNLSVVSTQRAAPPPAAKGTSSSSLGEMGSHFADDMADLL